MIEFLSNYDLLLELLYNGKLGTYPDLEPIDMNLIIKILEKRANRTFSANIKNIVNWFLETDGIASDQEKLGIGVALKIKEIEGKRSKILQEKGLID